jgi:ABC-type transport system involved in multi-copper enzyme maturation permease subunit
LALSAWIGPRLVSSDLSDNALPIFLSRPITRFEYVAGKLIVLFACLSAVTWVPILLLFVFQGYSAPVAWAGSHLYIAFGVVAGALIWIAFLSLLTLALSSWVKWRVVATGLIFAAVFVPAGVGTVFNAVVHTNWGFLINLPVSLSTLWRRLLQVPPSTFEMRQPLPISAIGLMLMLASAACVAALNARIRAREVVRG